jgi:hypothetical protein
MKTMINLLPRSLRRQQIVRRRLLQWSCVVCAVLVGGWTTHWFGRSAQRSLAQKFEVLSREHQPTQLMLQQLVDMRRELQELQQQEAIAIELEQQRNAMTLLGVISQTAKSTNGRLQVTELELTNFQSRTGADGTSPADGEPGALLISGVSLDNSAVAELMGGLQDSAIFSRVELLALKERPDAEHSLRDYEIRCDF